MERIDTSIYGQFQPPKINSPFENAAMMQQIQQGQATNRLAQMKFAEAERETERGNALSGITRQYGNTPEYTSRLMEGGFAKEAEARGKFDQDRRTTEIAQEKSQIAAKMEQFGQIEQIMAGVKRHGTQAAYDAGRGEVARILGQEAAARMPQVYDPVAIAGNEAQAMDVKSRLEQRWKELDHGLKTDKFAYDQKNDAANRGVTVRGQDVGANTAMRGQNMTSNTAAAGRAVTMRGQNMVDSRSSQTIAQGGGKPMTQAQEAKYRGVVSDDWNAANTNLSSMRDIGASIVAVRTAPGLERATGVMGMIPSMPGFSAAAAEVKMKNLEGKVTQLGKIAAAQGGAVGPMAVQEWKIVRDMIAALEPSKGKAAYLEQVALIEAQVVGSEKRLRSAYENQYGADFERYPQFSKLIEPSGNKKPTPAKAAGGFDAEKERRYQEWKAGQ